MKTAEGKLVAKLIMAKVVADAIKKTLY